MKKILIGMVAVSMFALHSCELLEGTDDGLTTNEVVNGLKKALELGTDSATTNLGLTNGYFGNLAVKIPLPEEALEVQNLIKGNATLNSIATTLGLHNKFDDVVLAVNRAAESASKEAAPIFKEAINGLNIAQAWDILNGIVPETTAGVYPDEFILKSEAGFDSIAATKYFKVKTFNPLVDLFGPKISTALDQNIAGLGFSATTAWNALTTTYNSFINNTTVKSTLTAAALFGNPIPLPNAINTDIGAFSTGKALDGLFFMVGKEEKKIRKDPYQWAVDIIQKVFGSIFEP